MTIKGPYSIKEHIGEGFINMDGEDKFYSVWDSNGNLIANQICSKEDAKTIALIPEIAKTLFQIKALNNAEVNGIIGPKIDILLAEIEESSRL